MPRLTPPIPQDKIGENFVWRDWFQRLSDKVFGTLATQDSHNVTITGGSISGISFNGIALTNSTVDNSPIGSDIPSTGNFTSLSLSNPLAVVYGGTGVNSAHINYVFAGPASGSAGAPTFRALAANDIPSLAYAPQTTGTSILYGNGSGGFSNVTIGSGVSFVGGTLSATGTGGTITSVTATTPLASSGGTTPNLTIQQSSSSQSGYLSSTDWSTFNGKQPAGTYVNSVSGTTGRVTSTGGTTPIIDLASGVATAGTTGSSTLVPVITIDTYGRVTSITTASNPQGTVTSVTGTSPVVSSGGTTPAINLATAYGDTLNPYAAKTANYVLAGPTTGAAAVPTFRALVAADIPSLSYVTSVSGTSGRITSTGGTTPVIDLASGVATAGTTGSSLLIPVVTIDTYGRVTGITTASNPQGTVTSVGGTGTVNGITLTGTVTSTGNLTLGGTLSGIANSQLTNSSITINGSAISLGGSVSVGTVTSVTGTAPVVSSGGATPAISMAAATTSVSGYLTSTDWNTFNNKQPAGSYLTAVTADAPLTGSGTSASHLSIPVATSSVNGYLSSTDWSTFNGKQAAGTYVTSLTVTGANGFAGSFTSGATPALTVSTSITGLLFGNGTAIAAATISAPLSYSAGTLSITQSTTSTNGYLNSTDWNTFNNKQAVSAPVTKTADFTVASTDLWLINNKSGSTCTVTLPTASTSTGRVLHIQNYQAQTVVSAASNVVAIAGGSAATAILNAVAGDTCTLVSDGTNWITTQYTPNNILLLE